MKDFIKEHWDQQASKHKSSYSASWADLNMIRLEIEVIQKYLRAGNKVLDVGCANGFAAFDHVQNVNLESLIGVDFSENMIAEAKAAQSQNASPEKFDFRTADIRDLPFASGSFDVVYTTRVLINLPTWQDQIRGIEECLRVAKPGGRVVFSEAFWEPLTVINAMRLIFGLDPLNEHDFNRYLKIKRLEAHLKTRGLKYKVEDFSSVYYLGTRLLRDLITDSGDFTSYLNPLNRAFFELEKQFSCRDIGMQKAYVIEVPEAHGRL
jgi:ubiquinone/menaquinone biosynthesis C-methylase UbiE